MHAEAILAWTQAHFRRECRLTLLGIGLLSLASAAVLAATLLLSAGGLWLALSGLVRLDAWVYLLLAAGWVALLFFGHARREPGYLNDLPFRLSPLGFARTGGNFNPLEPRYLGGMAQVAAETFYLGPRLTKNTIGLLLRYRSLARADAQAAGTALAWLAERPARVSLPELRSRFPDMDGDALLRDLRLIPGVLHLTAPAPGLSLSDSLRKELCQAPGDC
ncbi:MAG: hypothetical protein KIS92_26700 [Planctomycetota bacterium]|nr:hypothetical protein [Planctomycetota bacterium]